METIITLTIIVIIDLAFIAYMATRTPCSPEYKLKLEQLESEVKQS